MGNIFLSSTLLLLLPLLRQRQCGAEECRRVFLKAVNSVTDDPQRVCERLLQMEREEGTLDSFDAALSRTASQMQRIRARREKVGVGIAVIVGVILMEYCFFIVFLLSLLFCFLLSCFCCFFLFVFLSFLLLSCFIVLLSRFIVLLFVYGMFWSPDFRSGSWVTVV